jgi:Cft2 family RNA processing exonuclease
MMILPLSVKWDRGIAIHKGPTRLLLDPQVKPPSDKEVFITHAHYDHSKAFDFSTPVKHSTRKTRDLVRIYGKDDVNWESVSLGKTLKVGDLEVIAHNAGHILGSVMYEVVAPEGRLVYTGDANFVNTYTMTAAEAIECDVLVIETTFGLPSFVFPPQQEVATNMVQWAIDTLRSGRIPTFRTDALGNAQEIIAIFNRLTNIPVITHWKVTRINEVYEAHGHILDYTNHDLEKEEEFDKCIFIAPKRLNLQKYPNFYSALASGWAIWVRNSEIAFPLSDHADFPHLLEFVKACNPKMVLTCLGGRSNKIFADQVIKQLQIKARPMDNFPISFP